MRFKKRVSQRHVPVELEHPHLVAKRHLQHHFNVTNVQKLNGVATGKTRLSKHFRKQSKKHQPTTFQHYFQSGIPSLAQPRRTDS